MVFTTCGIPRGKNVVKVRIFEILTTFWGKICRRDIFLLENYVNGKTGRYSLTVYSRSEGGQITPLAPGVNPLAPGVNQAFSSFRKNKQKNIRCEMTILFSS